MKPLPPGKLRLVHLRRLRAQQRMTVRELAAKANLTPATVSRLENVRQHAHPLTAQSLADALGMGVGDLLGEEEPPEAHPSSGPEEPAAPAA